MTDHLVQQLRDADPAAALDPDPHGPTGRRVLAQARARGQGRAVRPRNPRPRRVVVAVAGLLVLSAAGAVAAGVFDPDPADVDTILSDAEHRFEVHLEGWRPELTSEAVMCAYEDGGLIVTSASEFPLDQPLTQDAITRECIDGNDQVRSEESAPPAATTLCGGTLPADAVEERLASLDARVLEGTLDSHRHRVPVVLGWEADCGDVQLDTPLDLSPLADLDAINTARAVEVRLKAAALKDCLSRDQAEQLAREGHKRLGAGWLLIDEAHPQATCHEVWVESDHGWVTIIGQP
jgi:hypothetical protein